MAGTDTAVVRLSDLADGQEAEVFAALVKKERGTDRHGRPYLKCQFRDRRAVVVAPLWFANPLREQAEAWPDGLGYRLRVKAEQDARYGLQLQVLECRPAVAEDAADGYDFFDLVEGSEFPVAELRAKVLHFADRYVKEPCLNRLVRSILDDHDDLLRKMPAAQSFHHSYTAGLIEHVWSMTRIAGFLADHYAQYYYRLNPPLNKGVIVAAAILHDIGKLRELTYHPVEARYTNQGNLVGHVLLGRDLVRDAARAIGDFPEETLLLLEHAILAHHGKEEFGAPKAPQTIEALIVHFADDIDSKINAVAHHRLRATGDDPFTDKVFALGRRIYRGIPVELPSDDDLPAAL
jgi:3'-5' exoribonuclease